MRFGWRARLGGDLGLVVDHAGGIHQHVLLAVEGIGVELKHEQAVLAGDHHRLLRDRPLLAVLGVGTAELPCLEAAECGGTAVVAALVPGQVFQLARGEFENLAASTLPVSLDKIATMVGGSLGSAGWV